MLFFYILVIILPTLFAHLRFSGFFLTKAEDYRNYKCFFPSFGSGPVNTKQVSDHLRGLDLFITDHQMKYAAKDIKKYSTK